MKNLIISIVALLLVTLLQAQDFERSNTVSIVSTPSSWDESFNLGVQYSYYNETIYVSPEIFIAPELDNIPYTHFALRFGLNQHFGKFERWGRVFTGIRIGVIRRDGYGHALLGLESGIDIFIPKTPFFGRMGVTMDQKGDSKVYSPDPYHNVSSVTFGIGVNF